MKISNFTFLRNAEKFDYPFNEKVKKMAFVYVQQKSIAYYNCTGGGVFYKELKK